MATSFRETDSARQDVTRRAPAGVHRSTETKSAFKTTEMVMTLVFVVAVLVAAYINNTDSFSRNDGWILAAIVMTGYIVSRGIAKAGVREPYIEDQDSVSNR